MTCKIIHSFIKLCHTQMLTVLIRSLRLNILMQPTVRANKGFVDVNCNHKIIILICDYDEKVSIHSDRSGSNNN